MFHTSVYTRRCFFLRVVQYICQLCNFRFIVIDIVLDLNEKRISSILLVDCHLSRSHVWCNLRLSRSCAMAQTLEQ